MSKRANLNRIRKLAGILTESTLNEEIAQAWRENGLWTDGTYTEGDGITYRGLGWNLEWEPDEQGLANNHDTGQPVEGAWFAVNNDGDEIEFSPGMEDRHDPQRQAPAAFPESTVNEVTGARPGSFSHVIDAIGSAIANAPDADKQRVAQALEDFAETFSGSYQKMMQSRTMGELLSDIAEASDARPGSSDME